MNISRLKIVILLFCLSGCNVIFPQNENFHGVNSDGSVNYEQVDLSTFETLFVSLSIDNIHEVSDNEDYMFSQLKPLLIKLLAQQGLCKNGFEFKKASLRYYEGGIISIRLNCIQSNNLKRYP